MRELLKNAYARFLDGRHAEADAICRDVLARSPGDIDALQLKALIHIDGGDPQGGLELIQRCIERSPDNPQLHHTRAKALIKLGRFDDGIAALQQAVAILPELSPERAALHNDLGSALASQQRFEAAIAAYREALRVDPVNGLTISNLAKVLERTDQTAEAQALLEEALVHTPDEPALSLALAKLDRRLQNFGAAQRRLEHLLTLSPPATVARDAYFELGRLCDRAGEPRDAFEHFRQGNALARRLRPPGSTANQPMADEADHLHEVITAEWLSAWTPLRSPAEDPQPVFLIGFPRSGTTLLDTILAAHEAIDILEEQPTVRALLNAATDLPAGFPEAFATLTEEQAAELRAVYRQSVRACLPNPAGRLIIDKSPLNTVYAGLLQRVFPEARFIITLRHPCDVCLSCWMHDFENRDIQASFYDLESTADLYLKIMNVWARYVDRLPIRYHEVRYEALVDDRDAVMRQVLAFLDLPWSDRVRDHVRHARSRRGSLVPGYDQVAEPIHRRARYRWQRYETELAPICARLEPQIRRLGYAPKTQ